MNVLVLGASGRTGSLIVSELFGQGHQATVLAREPRRVRSHAGRVRIYKGSVFDAESLDLAMAGQHAVIYALAHDNIFPPITFYRESTRLVLASMRKHLVQRLICITAFGVGDSRGHGNWLYENVLARHVLADKSEQEDLIRASSCDWIIVRPARLVDGKATRHYEATHSLSSLRRAGRISRADLAQFCVSQLASDEFLHKTPLLSY